MSSVDEIVEPKGESEWIAWKDIVLDSIDEIVALVARRRQDALNSWDHLLSWNVSREHTFVRHHEEADCQQSRKRNTEPNIDDVTLKIVYLQKPDFMLQLYDLDFTHIGAISAEVVDGANIWSVTGGPLTYNMN
ncbi:hypothetical protein ACJ72_02560 [Emergomyces africanus]|uniref:Uncharacterized protein n=1 Tax=Emergomyces africanus TaxID=1955775 RepID=A0A1B7P241_9EURO|nr:hypothetical protein ACJ72_02560 [Emergomyces africanus]